MFYGYKLINIKNFFFFDFGFWELFFLIFIFLFIIGIGIYFDFVFFLVSDKVEFILFNYFYG